MENFVFIPYLQKIPEWEECYFNFNGMMNMLGFVDQCLSFKQQIHKTIYLSPMNSLKSVYSLNCNQNLSSSLRIADHQMLPSLHEKVIGQVNSQIDKILQKWICTLLTQSEHETTIFYIFAQYKQFQINDKFDELKRLMEILKRDERQKQNISLLNSNLYIESFYLQRAIAYNTSQKRFLFKVLQEKMKKDSDLLEIIDPRYRMRRLNAKNNEMLNQIISKSKLSPYLEYRKSHEKQSQTLKQSKSDKNALIIGFLTGALIMLILAIPIHNVVNNLSLKNNQHMRDQFPMWRGASYIIFYMWIFGLDTLFYETSHINYHLILYIPGYEMPSSKAIFKMASFFSFLYISLFLIHIFQIANQIHTHFQYFAQIYWLIILLYLFVPNPFKIRKKGIQFSMLICKLFTSCLPGHTWNFAILVMSDQFLSFTQPSGDFFYTVCFTIRKNQAFCSKNSPNFSAAYIFFILIFRGWQCLRISYFNYLNRSPKTWDFMELQWTGFFRACFSTLLNISAIFYRLKTFKNAYSFYLIAAIINTLVAWFVDVKGDWGLLDYNNKTFLRQKLQFKSRKFYFFMMFCDFFLRAAWTLSLSPFILSSTGIDKLLYIMLVSYLQIVRRGIWNMLKVGFQHTKNCKQFQVTIRDNSILKEVKEKARQTMDRNRLMMERSHSKEKAVDKTEDLKMERQKSEKMSKQLRKIRIQRQLEHLKEKLKERKIRKMLISAVHKECERRLNSLKKIMMSHEQQIFKGRSGQFTSS